MVVVAGVLVAAGAGIDAVGVGGGKSQHVKAEKMAVARPRHRGGKNSGDDIPAAPAPALSQGLGGEAMAGEKYYKEKLVSGEEEG